MPSSHPDSTDSPKPSATPSREGATERAEAPRAVPWRLNASLFVATLASIFFVRMQEEAHTRSGVLLALEFTAALSAILVAHESGHYIAARLHKVPTSLPFFIPLPIPPFGTMGAVIQIRRAIPTRRALLDIGAAGPLAGLVFAIPLYAWGVAHSEVVTAAALAEGPSAELGSSLLTRAIEAAFGPRVPAGGDILLSPVAFAAWAGMLLTMINLLPVSQLDGGNVAFALFGARQNAIARWVHRSMLAFFFVSLGSFVARDLRAGVGLWHLGRYVNSAITWLILFELVAVLGSLAPTSAVSSANGHREKGNADADAEDAPQLNFGTRVVATVGLWLVAAVLHYKTSPVLWGAWFAGLGVLIAMEARWGALRPSSTLANHPPTTAQPLSFGRAAVAVLTLAFFVLLFMPVPITM
jgi:membrane-associated protease RseP (regulator of RpoE activity)